MLSSRVETVGSTLGEIRDGDYAGPGLEKADNVSSSSFPIVRQTSGNCSAALDAA